MRCPNVAGGGGGSWRGDSDGPLDPLYSPTVPNFPGVYVCLESFLRDWFLNLGLIEAAS